ncbi:outer membrane beta-barrel protein [Salinimicrobium soli]|uniref:outer membrane beta-barrel protein n=1 Tax=Salinimicrobium soli TaxID=1254399 RepID=UPI003AABB2BB
MKKILLFCALFIGVAATAQQFTISGKLVDSQTQNPLESATVFVETVKDSSLVSYSISGKDGSFVIEGSKKGDSLRFITTYSGYSSLNKIISLNQKEIALGVLPMEIANNMLDEVTVVSERAPVTIKSDTLEFNANSFNTRQDANLEELMKKLPGVEVDAQGNITVNGKPVSRILVNGKEFFGNDPKIATKNLPKEIIDKIQVVDTKTKTEEFTGKAGNPDDKTINVTIKKDKNKGYFARATAGGGTDERYELSGIGNYFKDDLRVSVLASSNNINSSGFSFDEVFDMMGGRARSISINRDRGSFSINGNSFGGGGGITKSETAGFNFSNDWNKKYELTADYFFGKNDTETAAVVNRETFLPTGTFYTNSVSEGNLLNESHRANAAFEVELDTLTKISVRPSVNINDALSRRSNASQRINATQELLTTTEDNEELNSSNFSNRLNFIRKFGSRGAYLQLNFENENNKQETENFFFSERLNYNDGALVSTDVRDQFIDEDENSDVYQAGITQRSVLAEKFFLDLSYQFEVENMSNTRSVFDYDEASDSYNSLNTTLSNDFEVKSIKHIPNAGLNYEGGKWRLGFNVGLLSTALDNENFLAQTKLSKNYNNLYLNTNVRYEIARGKSMYIYYRNDTDIPSIRQLQPVANITDPLNIVIGNPELRPTYTHRFNLGYHNFDFASRSGMNIYASVSFSEDQVVPYSLTEDLVTTTTFRNLDGGISAYAGTFYSKRYKKDKNEFNYRAGLNMNYNRQVGFTNGFQYEADRYGLTPSIRMGYNYAELVELNPRYSLDYNRSKYDINNSREEEYVNHSIGFEATTYWPKNVVFGNDISFNAYGNVAPGFDATSLLWNMSLGYKFWNDDATIKAKVYDLLNENVSTRRTTGEDYVQDTQELILEQYFMLSFTYKLSKFGGKEMGKKRGSIIMM